MEPHEHSGRSRAWELQLGRRRRQLGRSGTLLVSRVYEQTVLGLASLTLAWRLGVSDFAPVSMLLVFNSFSVIASDFGLGTDLMHRRSGNLGRRTLRRVRQYNVVVLLAFVAVGFVVEMPWRILIIGAGFVWVTSAEAFIRKSALIRLDLSGRAARCELIGSTVLGIGIGLALVFPDHAVAIVAAGLSGKHAVEALTSRGWKGVFVADGTPSWSTAVWLSTLLNFAIANVDFLIVAVVISSDAFSIYSLGFRVAAVFVAQVAYVVYRVALVDFGEAHRAGTLGDAYSYRRRQLFVAGIASGLITAAVAPLLVVVLGSQWQAVVGVVVVLSIATPWQMCSGLGLMSAIAVGHARKLARWEASRLVLATVALTVGGLLGFRYFAATAAFVAIVTAVGYDRAALGFAGRPRSSWILYTAPIACALVVLCAALLPFAV